MYQIVYQISLFYNKRVITKIIMIPITNMTNPVTKNDIPVYIPLFGCIFLSSSSTLSAMVFVPENRNKQTFFNQLYNKHIIDVKETVHHLGQRLPAQSIPSAASQTFTYEIPDSVRFKFRKIG